MKTKSIKILAIESSCDETAAAVIHVTCNTKRIMNLDIESNIISSQIKLHAKYGGVYPELASREHIKNILPVIDEATGNKYSEIDYLAVTNGPGLIGSLLVGVNTAKTLAYVYKKPIYAINHLEGHIYSCFAGANSKSEILNSKQIPNSKYSKIENCKLKIVNLPKFPILALIVSGGHTSLVYMKNHFDYKIIGETLDDAAGEAFDKVAKMLNLGYPGGPAIAKMAMQITNDKKQKTNESQSSKFKIEFPRPMINSKNFNFSFSGIKTSVLYTLKKLPKKLSRQTQANICKEFQDAVVETLVSKTLRAARKYQVKSILLCGGVSANSSLRNEFKLKIKNLKLKIDFFVPQKNLSTDNAAMIGIAAAYRIALGKKPTPWYDVNADANLQF